jgi:hypothetical protein
MTIVRYMSMSPVAGARSQLSKLTDQALHPRAVRDHGDGTAPHCGAAVSR